MSQAYLSIAIWEPLSNMETAALETIRELNAIVARKQYGHDLFIAAVTLTTYCCDAGTPNRLAAPLKKTPTSCAAGPAWETKLKF